MRERLRLISFRAKLEYEDELKEPLEKGVFELFYQPLVELATARIGGFEALIRWRSRKHGLVPPKDFIALAEETGLIVPMCRWALSAAADYLGKFQQASALAPKLNSPSDSTWIP